MNKEFFEQRHPLVITAYYILMLLILMSTTNPLIIISCFLGSFTYQLVGLNRDKKHSIIYPLLFLLIITLTNPLFVHRGATVLFFFLNRPFTQEALIYGFFMGLMIAGMIYLFQNFQSKVNSEQFFYLFGRRFPKLALILTMVFRFIPMLQQYYQELNQVQKTIHRTQMRTLKERVTYGLDLFGNLFSWMLENAMDSADSMKARGYGIGKRGSRIHYTWQKKDTAAFLLILGSGFLFIYFAMAGDFQFDYYPYTEDLLEKFRQSSASYLMIVFLAFLPTIKRLWEAMTWTILKSKI
ncbi:energy-coupling factor transporter transmembrane component T [Enterococcus termitis]|uniref:Cobalt transporter n=1 Tax=Enterococcus termitis TaxID=332950 RepID=A0A1E5H7W1_9ENTE|nr:energy-coupling factor transporter transmembrane component T [Enterococcus termitis]OEG20740.1 hypothetical protein BCR25_02690 [Enterococcus termitis]